MATWEATYTALKDINNGVEYKDGDAITTDSVNVPIKNSAYAIQKAEEAIIIANNAVKQTQREPVIIYEDKTLVGKTVVYLPYSGIYNVEIYKTINELDEINTYSFTIYYDKDMLADETWHPTFSFGNTIFQPDVNRGYLSVYGNGTDQKIIKVTRL